MELNISKLMELKPPDSLSTELRDHVLDLYQRVVISQLKQLIKTDDQLKKSEAASEALSERLEKENSHQKEYIKKCEDRADSLTMELGRFKSDHFNLMAQTAENAKKLEDELSTQPNYEYVKNVFINYLSTEDVQHHVQLLKAIFASLKFTKDEEQKVRDAFNANNTSYLGKISGSKLI